MKTVIGFIIIETSIIFGIAAISAYIAEQKLGECMKIPFILWLMFLGITVGAYII